MSRPHFLQPLVGQPAEPQALWNTRTGLPVATRLEAASDSASRRKGLLGRDGLEPGTALVILPTNLVHTFSMRFPIDICFASRTGKVVKVRKAVPRRRIAGALGGFAVIELAAGQLDASGTREGDQLDLKPLPSRLRCYGATSPE